MIASELRIRRLRARCPDDIEALHARLRIAHLLETADVSPPGLPPQAILLLRRLQAPQSLALEGVRVPVTWEQALRGEMDRQLQSAVRPLRGRIPSGAEAVLFADTSEMLACFGLLLRGRDADALWVWESAVGPRFPMPGPDALVRTWMEHPRAVPTALHHLDTWGEAVPVLQRLSEQHLGALFAVIVSEFDLSVRIEDLALPESMPLAPVVPKGETLSTEDTPPEATVGAWPVFRSILRERSSEEGALSPAAQGLLTLARAITHASSIPEVPKIFSAIRAETLRAKQPPPTPAAAASPVPVVSTQRPPASAGEGAAKQDADNDLSAPAAATSVPPGNESKAKGAPQMPFVTSPPASLATPAATADSFEDDLSVTTDETNPWDGLAGTSTRAGGVFYLFNLFLRRDAPACFDAEFALSDHISQWGLMQGFGEWLLGAADDGEVSTDALWSLLARLDGRKPGEPIAPHLPDRERTLQIVFERLRSELDTMLNAASADEAGSAARYEELLCRPAIIYSTRTHVDVVLPLDAIWLPARRAGLDASPGWVPDLMRVILFHFV